MKNKILLIIISFFCLAYSNLEIENPCSIMTPRGGDEDWGIGAFLIPEKFEIEILNDTSGKIFGKFQTSNSNLRLKNNQGKNINYNFRDVEWIGHYSNEIIKVRKCSNPEFIKILWKTSKDELFLSKKELKKKGAIFYSYQQLLFDESISIKRKGFHDWVNIGVNLEKSCLNLRTNPSIKSEKIKCILSNDWNKEYHTHMKILETKNNWAKVETIEYYYDAESDESGEGCTFIEKNKEIGWLKAIDETGFPNIWFSTTSY